MVLLLSFVVHPSHLDLNSFEQALCWLFQRTVKIPSMACPVALFATLWSREVFTTPTVLRDEARGVEISKLWKFQVAEIALAQDLSAPASGQIHYPCNRSREIQDHLHT